MWSSQSIWNRLVPGDLLRTYKREQKRRRAMERPAGTTGVPGPVDGMMEALRVSTGGLHSTRSRPTCRMFLTWKNKLKCRAILDARTVNEDDPHPRRSSVCLVWRAYVGGWDKQLGGGEGTAQEFFWPSWTFKMLLGALSSHMPGGGFSWSRVGRAGDTGMQGSLSDGATA